MFQPRVGPLLRATSATSAAIWVECDQPMTLTVAAQLLDSTADSLPVSTQAQTLTCGGHYYALLTLTGLRPASWYHYSLQASDQTTAVFCFRTFDDPQQPLNPETRTAPTLAYGSCRKLSQPALDTLSTLGRWLKSHESQRELLWPRLLLLIGDQIYADQPPPALVATNPSLRDGASSFADFALMYNHAWTSNPDIRYALAQLPTFMIFDDHEITNNWNIVPSWRAEALRGGQEQTLVDGLVAYWLYQGWGNLDPQQASAHPLTALFSSAQESGADILEELRTELRREVYGEAHNHWHYTINSQPPIFVSDVRADRPAHFAEPLTAAKLRPGRIMSQTQMEELRVWLRANDEQLALLVSSVPVLLPPAIGLGEYWMGMRPWHQSRSPLRSLGQRLAGLQQRLALGTSFDHWPVFNATWRELRALLAERQRDVVALSGDVHFSYACVASRRQQSARLYQLVSTPFQNALGSKDGLLIRVQSGLKSLAYGGLRVRMLPLTKKRQACRTTGDILLENTIAFVTISYQATGGYTLRQTYMGQIAETLEPLAESAFSSQPAALVVSE